MQKIQLNGNGQRKVRDNYPIIITSDFKDPHTRITDGSYVSLMANSLFLGYAIIAQHRQQAGWLITTDQTETPDEAYFQKLFQKSVNRRLTSLVPSLPQRVFNAEGDGLGGLTIDHYGEYYVFNWYAQGVYQQRDMLYRAFISAIGDDFKGIYEKLRFNVGQDNLKSQLVRGVEAPDPLLVTENQTTYPLHLANDLGTGLLLEYRQVREWLTTADLPGKTVLNLFSQENGLTAAAAVAGAAKTISIDTSKKGQAAIAEQLAINNLDPEKQEIRTIDIPSYLDYATKHRLSYDIVLLTAPTFARFKKQRFQVTEDLTELLAAALPTVRQGGQLVVSTTAPHFSLKRFKEAVDDAFIGSDRKYQLTETFRLPTDFVTSPVYAPSNYLKALVLTLD